jgi:hypothetical protein
MICKGFFTLQLHNTYKIFLLRVLVCLFNMFEIFSIKNMSQPLEKLYNQNIIQNYLLSCSQHP